MVSAIDANSVKESGDHDTCSDVVTVNNVVKLITSIRFLPQCHSCCKSELKQISDLHVPYVVFLIECRYSCLFGWSVN